MMERAAEFRATITEIREKGGPRWRAPKVIRKEIAEWASDLRWAGYRNRAIAESIGVCDSTLRRWLTPNEVEGQLRPVRIDGTSAQDRPGALAVVSPSGYRLEGLTADQALEILRRL